MKKNPITGKVIEWSFDDGPMAGKKFEHTFEADGTASYRMPGADGSGQPTRVENAKVEPVGEDVFAVSYLGSQGYTLTTILDLRTHHLVSFSSNDKQLSVQKGKFKLSGDAPADKAEKTEPKHASSQHSPHRH